MPIPRDEEPSRNNTSTSPSSAHRHHCQKHTHSQTHTGFTVDFTASSVEYGASLAAHCTAPEQQNLSALHFHPSIATCSGGVCVCVCAAGGRGGVEECRAGYGWSGMLAVKREALYVGPGVWSPERLKMCGSALMKVCLLLRRRRRGPELT